MIAAPKREKAAISIRQPSKTTYVNGVAASVHHSPRTKDGIVERKRPKRIVTIAHRPGDACTNTTVIHEHDTSRRPAADNDQRNTRIST
jgi:hypothetical protein